jgi:hypothetical protein
MMAQIRSRFKHPTPELTASRLYDEQTFYHTFEYDLACCRNKVVIESPFITTRRIEMLIPALRKITARGVRVIINTRHPQEHDDYMRAEAKEGIALLQDIGVEILFTGGHHRKLAIFDGTVLWEGSLNILSQNDI